MPNSKTVGEVENTQATHQASFEARMTAPLDYTEDPRFAY
jgi:hypothetical protein